MAKAFGAAPRRPVRMALLAFLLILGLAPARGLADVDPLSTQLFLSNRFEVEVDWTPPGGTVLHAQAVPLTDDTGAFWFSSNDNLEVVVRVLDRRAADGHFWVVYGALADFQYQITVTDTMTGAQKVYANPAGRLAGGTDKTAFGPEPPPIPTAIDSTLPDPAPSRLGPEFQVNVTAQGNQNYPAVAVGPDGRSMIVWQGEPAGLQGRVYDSAGLPLGGEIYPASGASMPLSGQVAADPTTGRYMVVWNDQVGVKGRIYGPDGQPSTDAFAIGTHPQQQGGPEIVADPAGGFLVAWPEESDQTLRLQRFSSLGVLVGTEAFLYEPQGFGLGLAAYPAGGGFVVAWTQSVSLGDYDVWAMRLDSSARPIGTVIQANDDFTRHPGFNYAPVPVVHPDGGFSIVWTNFAGQIPQAVSGLFARRYDVNGQPVGNVLTLVGGSGVGEWSGNAVGLPAGKTMVFWYDERAEDISGGTFARLYDASWQPLGTPFRVNTYTANLQVLPAAAANASGTVVTAWTSTLPNLAEPPPVVLIGQDGDGDGVFAQRFDIPSCATGDDQLCLNGRFRVRVRYTDPASGAMRFAHAATLTSDTGAFWFVQPSDTDLAIKVIDGRAFNGHFWVTYGALSDLAYTVTVTDTVTGKFRRYRNPAHHQGSGKDLTAF